ncbi:MAG: sugar ABC transporter permease [Candidatus Methanomethylicaceae archaeon]
MKKPRNLLRRKEAQIAYLFILPTFIGFIVFVIGPMFASMFISLYRWDILSSPQFLGLGNYFRLLRDMRLLICYSNTFRFVIFAVSLNIVSALFIAVAINARMNNILRGFYRSALFLPVMISAAAVSVVWFFLLDTDFGVVNYYLMRLGLKKVPWLTSSQYSLWSVILVDVWKTLGFNVVLFSAGLQNIPRHLYEAALIDGANRWHSFRYITLPMLSPTLFFAIVWALIGAFQVFDYPFIMTQGGPGDSSRTIVLYLYEHGFRFFSMGYASTIALSLFGIILLLTILQLRFSGRWVFYG